MSALPVDSALPRLRAALEAHPSAVLEAPPGAGKTTRVPLALLGEAWLAGARIVMLEPRRLAARAAAAYMAKLLGQTVGETVGHRVRFDSRVGPRTRIEVVTEGVLTRMLRDDPALEGVGLVIFDEFHERSLHADLGLAMTLHARSLFNPDLRVLVMSATLDTGPVAALLGGAPVVAAAGRAHPVQTRYLDALRKGRLEDAVTDAVANALDRHEGDVLVFLPGAREIRRVEACLAGRGFDRRVRVAPLFGDLSQDEQDRAIAPSPPGSRKVVLATSIAETSLTIEGVRVVVDAGLMRVPRFSPRTGLTRLETVTVTRDAAEQRRGRAARLGPGVCYRLWTEPEEAGFVPHRLPEILDADLAPLALELAAWGVTDPAELAWLDRPPAAAFAQATELLAELRALDANGAITPHGRLMAALPAHPRLAHMILEAEPLGAGGTACDLAALLEERDILARTGAPEPDVRSRLALLVRARAHGIRAALPAADPGALHRALRGAQNLRRAAARTWTQPRLDRARHAGVDTREAGDDAGLWLAFAYPDRIAQRRGPRGRFLLRSGRAAALPADSDLAGNEFIVAADVDERGPEGRIFLAAPISREQIETHFSERFQQETRVEWVDEAKAVRAARRVRLGALLLEEKPFPDPPPDAVTAALLEGIARAGIDALPWTAEARSTQARLGFLRRLDPEAWPDASNAALLESLPALLGPAIAGFRSLDQVRSIDLDRELRALVPARRYRQLDDLAPTHLAVPSGSRIPIDYSDPDAPAVAVRIQEVFGLTETPRLAGTVPLTFRLLSPAHRPVQVTRDLASFWRTGYFEVKNDLKGRYPKHYWPEDPLRAEATRRTRPRR